MKINPINNASFGRFRVTEQGADVIARNFVQNPETEEYFIDKIIKPLENCSVDVVHNGYSPLYKGSDDKYYLIQYASATGNEAVVTPTSGKTAYVRSVYYLPPNKKYAPRKYPDIEMARDIALNIEKNKKKTKTSKEKMEPRNLEAITKATTFEEKSKALFDILG